MTRAASPHLAVITTLLLVSSAHGLVIVRFGGQDLPPPVEANQTGVVYVQRAWDEIDAAAGGSTTDLELNAESIAALRRNPDVNVAPTAPDRGGTHIRPNVNGQVWDGDTTTVWTASRYLCAEIAEGNYFLYCTDDFGTEGTANITLGGQFQIDRIRVISGLRDQALTVQALRIFMDVQMPFTSVTHHPRPFSPWITEVRDNREQVLDIELPPHDDVGYIQVTLGEHDTPWEVHEIQIYAKGFVQRSTYRSDILDLGQPMAWGQLRWGGEREDRAKVSIQSRSGGDATPERFWRYTGRGDERAEVTPDQYGDLRLGERAGTTHDQENWSFWSSYDFADSLGTQIVSPGPRQYLQFLVDFLPVAEDGADVRFLEFRASEPVASNLVGEVWPVLARVGEPTQFTYALRPTISGTDAGFDRLEILSPSLLGDVHALRVGDVDVPYTMEVQQDHHLSLLFDRLEAGDSGALLELEFTAQVLRYGAGFEARVSDSQQPIEVPQGVTPGDAAGEYEGNQVSVATTENQQLLTVRVPAVVLTPNGDGHNDDVRLEYDVLDITGRARLDVEVHDMAGRLIRTLREVEQSVGSYMALWDGRDAGGTLVSPGVYLYSIRMKTDRDHVRKVGALYVAY